MSPVCLCVFDRFLTNIQIQMETVEVGLGEFGAAVHVVDAFTSAQSHTHIHIHKHKHKHVQLAKIQKYDGQRSKPSVFKLEILHL